MAPKDEVAQHPRILKDENHQTHGAQSESEYENGYDNRNWKRSILKKLQEWWKDEGVSQTKWTAVTVIIAAAVTAYIRQRQHTPRLTSHNKTEPSMVSSPTKYGSSSSSLLFLLWKTMSPTPRSIVDSSLSLLQMAARQGLVKRALVGSGEILYQSRDSDTWKRSQIPSNSHGIQADLLALLTQGGCEDIAALPDSLASRLAGPILAALPFVYLALVYKIFKNIHNGGNDLKLLSNNVTMTTHFTDVAGLEPIMPEVEEIVHFLRNPHKYRVLGAQPPRGILLQGPPGAGKTLLARAVAGEANTAFCACSGSDFCEMYVGKGAARVRNLFQRARSLALQRSGQSWWSRLWMPPSHLAPPTAIIFIDEFDALAKSRSYGGLNGNDERESTLNQLLTEMDGFATHDGVTIILIAATNRPDVLDPAVLRRFDRQIHVSYPNASGRQDIFKVHAKVTNCNMEEIDWGMLASDDLTTNFSGSDLKNVVNDAALLAVRDRSACVQQSHLQQAIERARAMKVNADLGRTTSTTSRQRFLYFPPPN